jgi:hypothetical protein
LHELHTSGASIYFIQVHVKDFIKRYQSMSNITLLF